MSTGALIGAAAVVVVAVLLLIRLAARSVSVEQVHAHLLRTARGTTAAALETGATGRLAGVVTADALLKAPLTGRACVGYVARVEEWSGGRRAHWIERIHEVRGVPFTIDDGTGRALIDPAASTMLLQMDATTRSGRFDDATPVEEAFLARHEVRSTGWFLNRTLRYTEGVIEPGERVAVIGRGEREADVDGPHGALATRVRLRGTADEPVLVTDRADLIAGGT